MRGNGIRARMHRTYRNADLCSVCDEAITTREALACAPAPSAARRFRCVPRSLSPSAPHRARFPAIHHEPNMVFRNHCLFERRRGQSAARLRPAKCQRGPPASLLLQAPAYLPPLWSSSEPVSRWLLWAGYLMVGVAPSPHRPPLTQSLTTKLPTFMLARSARRSVRPSHTASSSSRTRVSKALSETAFRPFVRASHQPKDKLDDTNTKPSTQPHSSKARRRHREEITHECGRSPGGTV